MSVFFIPFFLFDSHMSFSQRASEDWIYLSRFQDSQMIGVVALALEVQLFLLPVSFIFTFLSDLLVWLLAQS